MEELDFIIETTKELMDESIKYLEKELLNIRAGKANPNMISSLKVEYYGSLTPLNQISNIGTQILKQFRFNHGKKINYKTLKKL